MKTKSESKYLLELNERLRQIFEVARDHVKDFGLDEDPPPVDVIIQSTLEILIEMETDELDMKNELETLARQDR